jgi:DnaJ-class molecular chaperone
VAYEILSDPEKKNKYDNMITSKKHQFTETIFLFIEEITNPKTIHNLMNRPDIIQDIRSGDIQIIAQKLIQKILDNIDLDIDISKITDIFIRNETTNDKEINIKSDNSNSYDTSNFNTLNIIGNVNVSLYDIYHNRLKEIIIDRKIHRNNITHHETNTYYIPLYDSQVTIIGAGEKIINDDQTIKDQVGDVILNIKCEKFKSDNIVREGYNIIYNDNITLYELFTGFNKNIDYFDSIINICSTDPFKEYIFDGNKISICIQNKGLPRDANNNRGDLIIYLHLIKSLDFDKNLEKYFSDKGI